MASKDTTLIVGAESIFASSQGGVFFLTDNGSEWKCLNTNDIKCISFIGSNIYVGAYGIYCSTNSGTDWNYVDYKSNIGKVYAIASNGKSLLAASSWNSNTNRPGLYVAFNNKNVWEAHASAIFFEHLNDAAVINSFYIVGTNSGPYLSLDDGISWNLINEGIQNKTINVLLTDEKNILAGTNAGIYVSSNNGLKWLPAYDGLKDLRITALAKNGLYIFAGTDNGFFLSSNKGNSWIPVNNGLTEFNINNIAIYKGCVYLLIGNQTIWKRSIDEITSIKNNYNKPVLNFILNQNYPNPFNPTTNISFSIPQESFVTLKIYDVLGRETACLVSEKLAAGAYSRQWNATGFTSGVYFYRFQAGIYSEIRKLNFIK